MASSYPAPEELAALSLHSSWIGAPEPGDSFDPWAFDDRMATYRELMTATNRRQQFGDDNRRNPLWGLMFQHQWQFDTGRIGPDCRESRRIDPDAGWGFGNYTLSVVPWLGAVAAGVVPDRELTAAPATSRFEYIGGGTASNRIAPVSYVPGVAAWREYFTTAAGFEGGDDDPLRMKLWAAHKVCLDVASAALRTISAAPYSELELAFLQGWCRMVDYLWAAAWPTDFDFMSEYGLDVLPDQLLIDTTRDLPPRVRGNVRNVIGLAALSDRRYAVDLALWRRAMRTRSARQRVLPMLDAIFDPSLHNAGDILRLLGYLARPGSSSATTGSYRPGRRHHQFFE